MQAYLQDKQFLKELCQERNRTIYGKMLILDFQETPIEEIYGVFT
jgi:hypothetical protein